MKVNIKLFFFTSEIKKKKEPSLVNCLKNVITSLCDLKGANVSSTNHT